MRYLIPSAALILAINQPACCNAEPTIVELDEGRMFVPPQYSASGQQFDVLIHFHGDWNVVRRNFERSRLNAVLIVLNYKGLSTAYSKPFRDARRFREVLEEVTRALRKEGIIDVTSHLGRVYLSSFSAGYGAVRAILQRPADFQIIDGILMADSIYAGFEGDDRKVDPQNMQAFRRFAAAAAEGNKVFVLTHSYLHTPTYASTKETADDLIDFVGAERDASPPVAAVGMKLQRSHRRRSFVVLGYAGTDGEDHLQHLRHIGTWMPLLRSLESSKQHNSADN
jgi:hypothetical protein